MLNHSSVQQLKTLATEFRFRSCIPECNPTSYEAKRTRLRVTFSN